MFLKKNKIKQNFLLNFGPQHPAAHGVLRLILILDGEKIVQADPHIGFLHRGTEKLIETKHYIQSIGYFDRLDYVSMLSQEHSFILAIESFLNLKLTLYFQYIRIIFDEITRILNHLMSLMTHALDVGALTPFLWGFEEREKLMEFYERASGARLHATYYYPGGIRKEISKKLIKDILHFTFNFSNRIDEIEELLNVNIWHLRLQNIGIVSTLDAIDYSFTGPMLRGSGIPWDLRKVQKYSSYSTLNFNIPIGTKGDCYSRYLVRIHEMRISLSLIQQSIYNLKNMNAFLSNNDKEVLSIKNETKSSMETLIQHFKYYSFGFAIPIGTFYSQVESPKGEFGVTIYSNESSTIPYRCKIKSPGFMHLQSLNVMSSNHLLSDIVTIIGSQDIVFGEIDR